MCGCSGASPVTSTPSRTGTLSSPGIEAPPAAPAAAAAVEPKPRKSRAAWVNEMMGIATADVSERTKVAKFGKLYDRLQVEWVSSLQQYAANVPNIPIVDPNWPIIDPKYTSFLPLLVLYG